MPKRYIPPPHLVGRAFSTAALDLTAGQLRSRALQTSFRGVRSIGLDLASLEHRCLAYAARMKPDAAFSSVTAALLWRMPLPLAVGAEPLHVTVPTPGRAPRGDGVIGHRSSWLETTQRMRLRCTSAVSTWCDLASALTVPDLIAVGDYVLTGDPYKDVLPLATVDELRAAVELRTGTAGHRARVSALARIEQGPLSRPESLLRLLVLDAGLPHPLINESVSDERGSFLAMPDLSWPGLKVALEYEGDHHRGTGQFRRDIRRVERLVDYGWIVVKASADDLFDLPGELVARVARRLRSRGWVGRIRLPRTVQFVQ